jgi:hypothetical protein
VRLIKLVAIANASAAVSANTVHETKAVHGLVSTLAGSGSKGSADGIGSTASLNGPAAISYSPSGNFLALTTTTTSSSLHASGTGGSTNDNIPPPLRFVCTADVFREWPEDSFEAKDRRPKGPLKGPLTGPLHDPAHQLSFIPPQLTAVSYDESYDSSDLSDGLDANHSFE